MGGMGEGGWKGRGGGWEGRGRRGEEGEEGGGEKRGEREDGRGRMGGEGDGQQSFQYRLQRVTYICIWGENQTIVLMGELWHKFLQNL